MPVFLTLTCLTTGRGRPPGTCTSGRHASSSSLPTPDQFQSTETNINTHITFNWNQKLQSLKFMFYSTFYM